MKFIILLLLLCLSTLFASSAKEIFPTILSSQSTIELRKPILVQKTDFLQSAELINEENCLLKMTKHNNKKHKEKHNNKQSDKEVLCKHNSDSITALPPFKFFPTNNQETLKLHKKRKTFKQSHIPSLVISKSKTHLVFKAPKDSKGKRVQHIGCIIDTARVSSYTFHEGDYYIESLDIQSDDPKKNDLFTLKTKGKVRIFLNSASKIVKRAEKYKKRGYIELNYKNKSSDHLVIFAKSNLTIDASRRFKIKGFIYGYEDITLIGNKNSTYQGAVTAQGTLTLGKEEAKHWKQEKAGEYIYAKHALNTLNLEYPTEESISPTLTTLSLESNVTTLNVGEKAELTITATYSDNSTKEVNANVEYIITPSDSAEMNGTVLTAKKDTDITVQVKVNDTLSNTLNLHITWVVNGHVLPPEPNKVLNDSTLLGIDVNDNGVRDDVERWIYEEYRDKHPIYVDIAMQEGKADKLILEHPQRAKEIHNEVDKAVHCQSYYKYYAEYFNEPNLIQENSINEYFRSKIYFNTKERMDAYDEYDTLLSGDSYTLPKIEKLKVMCDFNTSKYEE